MSDRIMQRLAGGGRTGVFLGAIVAVLIGLFLPGWVGAILLTVIVAGMGWLMARTWAVAPASRRTVRFLILAVLAAVAIAKII
jgi:hypothetical protein